MLFNSINKIIRNGELLSVEHKPARIIGRQKEIKDISFNLSYFFREFPSLPKLIVYGPTGSGKTTVMNYILEEFKKESINQNKKLKIVKIKGSDSKSKYEIIKQIIKQIDESISLTKNTSECRDKLINLLQERSINLLIFIDEIHSVSEQEIDGILYFVSRLGEDLNYYDEQRGKLTEKKKSMVGYILVSNDLELISRKKKHLQENTRSSLTKEKIMFSRYNPEEICDILEDRINQGALYENKIDEEALMLISTFSVKEGEDSRYAILLLSKVCKIAEEKNMEKITIDLVKDVNAELKKNLMKEMIRNYPNLYHKVLSIIYFLHRKKIKIDSGIIYTIYEKDSLNYKIDLSRISQIITDLEKDGVIYTFSKSKKRVISIGETYQEIYESLKEVGFAI